MFSTPYINSISILFFSFLLSIFLALFLTFFYIKSSEKSKKGVRGVLFFIESMPDALTVVLIQICVIWIFKNTGILLSNVVSFGGDSLLVLPILCLTIIPTLQLFNYFTSYVLEEQDKLYVQFLYSKGLRQNYIIIVHLFRNALIHLVNHSKGIFLFMLSNLLILELILNVDGMMRFIQIYGLTDHRVLIWSLLSLYIPFFVIMRFGDVLVFQITGKSVKGESLQ